MEHIFKQTKQVRQVGNRFLQQFKRGDPYIAWLRQPHTVTVVILGCALAVHFAWSTEQREMEQNIKYGLVAMCISFLIFSAVQMHDGLFVRPHPIFWRVVMGIGVLYIMLLVFILFQTVEDVRIFLKRIDPKLGVPLPERSYAENCDFYTPNSPSKFQNLMDTINDEFIAAHFFGWFGKAFLIRDWHLLWIMSILFELLELSFEHLLPNFAECWWDHIILDVLVCNGLGIALGLKLCQWMQIRPYSWIARKVSLKVEVYNWEVLTSFGRMCSVIILIIVISLAELNAFFLKFILWIPPPHPVNIIRLFIWWAIGLPGMREYYQFVVDKDSKTFGTMSWICLTTITLECLICLKFGKGMFPKQAPTSVVLAWLSSGVIFAICRL